ncbi:MAG: M4 family metallopeptidase, partial [Bacteroidota bacterium]
NKEVHTNSGVQNHFFYLLVEGGTGVNDVGNHYDVSGIGIDDAIDIAWTAHQYLFDAAEYIDARDAWLEAAMDIFGNCTNQMIQVGNAWHAVGVGAQSPYYSKTILSTTLTAATSNNTQQAINMVQTGGNVNINSISGSYEVRLYAGNLITLNPGFIAPSGTAFRAKVNPCSITLHSPLRQQSPEENISSESKNTSSITDEEVKVRTSPNPFTQSTALEITLSQEQELTVSVFDAMGKKLNAFDTRQTFPAGTHQIKIDGSDLSTGLYYAVITTAQGKKMVQKMSKIN